MNKIPGKGDWIIELEVILLLTVAMAIIAGLLWLASATLQSWAL